MITQRLLLPFLLMLITDVSAIFYFLKDHKYQQSYEEVDNQNYHHHDEHKHHLDDHKHQNHKYQGYKHQQEHKSEHKHHELNPQQMNKHHEYNHHHDYHHYHHGYEHQPELKYHEQQKYQNYKYQRQKQEEEHKHHEYKPEHKHHEYKSQPMQKHHEYDHHHHDYHHYHHGYEHKHQEENKHDRHNHNHKHNDNHKYHEHHQEHKHQEQPHYEFKYGVRDPNTGDIKNQWEMRKGDEVQGEYSLVEADGTIRTVRYTAGKHTGFNAIVKKEGKAKHPIGFEPQTKSLSHQSKSNFQSIKPVHQEQDRFDPKAKGSRIYTDVDKSRLHYQNPSDLPMNHKPIFSGIDEETNLLALYKKYPVHKFYSNRERGFDYGISEYLTKRSYDLNKITDVLNASPVVDPIRAARGSFVMGR